MALAFAADGKAAASAGADSTVLIWDLDGLEAPKTLPTELTAAEVAALWAALKREDATKAGEAAWQLAASPKQTLPYLRERLKPAAGTDARGLAKLLADLDDDEFDVRERATQELAALGRAAEPFVQEALRKGPSPEAKTRIEKVLAPLSRAPAPEQIRTLRAVEVLEHMGTAGSRELLDALTKGAVDSPLTRDAKAALARLTARPAP